MCPGLTQPITVAIESHHYSQQTAIFRHQMNVSFLPNQLRRFINHHLRVVSHLIIWFRDLLSQHHLLCAVKINPTCDIWGKDLTKDGEGSTWDTLCRARYTDLAWNIDSQRYHTLSQKDHTPSQGVDLTTGWGSFCFSLFSSPSVGRLPPPSPNPPLSKAGCGSARPWGSSRL